MLRKADLTKEEKKTYNQIINTNGSLRIRTDYWLGAGDFDDNQRLTMLRIMQVYIYNSFFTSWILNYVVQGNNKKKPEVKALLKSVKWYFDCGLIPLDTELAIARKENWSIPGNAYKYNFIDLSKKTSREITKFISIDPRAIFDYAMVKKDKQLLMLCVKRRPALFNLISYQLERNKIISKKFYYKIGRMALLQPSRIKAGLYAPILSHVMTPTFIKRYVSLAGSNLLEIPAKYITKELCLSAVNQAGTALQYVPEKFKTDEVCAAALNNSPTSLKYMTAAQQKSKLTLKALLKNNNARNYLKKGAVGASAK